MVIKAIGIDLAKSVFSLYGIDDHGKCVLRKTVKRHQLLNEIAKIPKCLIGMEACSSAQHWAHEFIKLGHDARIMPARFVIPYRKSQKNDSNDAEAICEAVTRPNMRFVAIKSAEQQAVLCLHRLRRGLIKDRTARINRLRGLLAEYGFAAPKGRYPGQTTMYALLEDAENSLPDLARRLLKECWDSIEALSKEIQSYDRQLSELAKQSESAKRLMTIPGIGEITATGLVATISDGKQYDNGRQLAAWLGLVPRQYSTGGKPRLGRISKQGDSYLRTLLIHGARAVVSTCKDKEDKLSLWIKSLLARVGFAKTTVALAAKNARIAWALLTRETEFKTEIVTS